MELINTSSISTVVQLFSALSNKLKHAFNCLLILVASRHFNVDNFQGCKNI